jgi:hypothetical protein
MPFFATPLGTLPVRSGEARTNEEKQIMYPRMPLDLFEKWLPRRVSLKVALGIWVAGFVVAGATAWRMDHPTAGPHEATRVAVDVEPAPPEAASESAESERVVMPVDEIVGIRTPKVGVALRQKP